MMTGKWRRVFCLFCVGEDGDRGTVSCGVYELLNHLVIKMFSTDAEFCTG